MGGSNMDDRKMIDNALCRLNQDYLDLRSSREYIIGEKICKFIDAIKHLNLSAFSRAFRNSCANRKIRQYNKKNENFLTYNEDIITKGKIAVYTCLVGDYDILDEPVYCPPNIDYFIVTNLDIPNTSMWKKIDVNDFGEVQYLDNTKKSRYAKILPHRIFKNYEYSIYIDPTFLIVGDLSKYIKCVGGIPFASNWHSQRNSIYDEAEVCIIMGKEREDIIHKQIKKYRDDGMPENFGLIECNMLVRKHFDEKCIRLMEDWWKEYLTWGRRDQLSLPYVIWKNGYTMHDIGFIGSNVRANPSLRISWHKH